MFGFQFPKTRVLKELQIERRNNAYVNLEYGLASRIRQSFNVLRMHRQILFTETLEFYQNWN